MVNDILDLAIQIQQIPAPTFAEGSRGEFVRGLFRNEGLKDVAVDEVENVFARLPGKNSRRPLVVTAHMDTVFPAQTSLQVRREAGRIYGPGIGDNSLGVAALIGIIRSLRDRNIQLENDLWLAANVGEEGLGDLRGMRAVVERFGAEVTGYLVVEGLALGHVYHRGVGVRRYRITARTSGGHAWSDYGQPSAVHELAALVTRLTSLQLPRESRTTMNVGTIGGGTGINVIASEAICELDLRSENPSVLEKVIREVEGLIQAANRAGVSVTAEIIGQRPAGEIPADHPFVLLAVECLRAQGFEAALTSGSTDANIPLSRGIPAVVLGVTTGGGAHTLNEFIDVEPVGKGLGCLVRFVEGASNQ